MSNNVFPIKINESRNTDFASFLGVQFPHNNVNFLLGETFLEVCR